ncbi:right-handed parallel beta-helix repeat-containing protein [bacterium]|nr:right-handed parallel beta-helix repeat-containing protein [bacterium]
MKIESASNKYNCHGYAWHLSEGQADKVWIGTREDLDVEIYYWTDGAWSNDSQPSYQTSTEATATHAWYSDVGDDHSVRKIQNSYPVAVSGGRDYISKWGYFGLYQHEKGHDIYKLESTTGFAFKKVKTTHGGTLTNYNKTWVGAGEITHTISSDVLIASGKYLRLKSGTTVDRDSYFIQSQGTGKIIKEASVTIDDEQIQILDGAVLRGVHSTLLSTLSYENSDNTIEVDGGTHTINSSRSIASGVTLDLDDASIAVTSSAVLTVYAGCTFNFSSGKSLDINGGALDVNGSEYNRVTFTSTATWEGLDFDSSTDNDLNWCIINNGTNGIHMYESSGDIYNSKIHDNSSRGLYLYDSDVELVNNLILENGSHGIEAGYYSNIDYSDYNTIDDNGGFGISCHHNAYVEFGYPGGTGWGYNHIVYNQNYGLFAIYAGDIFLGSSEYNGRNTITANYDYQAYAKYGADITAQYCWWDGEQSNIYTCCAGTIDNSNHLGSDPGGGSDLSKIANGDNFAGDNRYADYDPENPDTTRLTHLWPFAKDQLYEGDFQGAVYTYMQLIRNFPASDEAWMSLFKLFRISNSHSEEFSQDSCRAYMSDVRNNLEYPDMLTQTASDYLVELYRRSGDFITAMEICEEILSESTNRESEQITLFQLFSIHKYDRQDISMARRYLETLNEEFPNYPPTLEARHLMGENVDWSVMIQPGVDEQETPKATINPVDYELRNNYPNPFNPITLIKYSLPEYSDVRISIYDFLGREVITLANEKQSAGRKQIKWQGLDHLGNPVASGMYVYTINVKSLESGRQFGDAKKMILIK